MMMSIFAAYYVEVFLNVHHLADSYFYIGQILYAIWNMINDPVFGYVSDALLKRGFGRNKQILLGAPVFALGFIMPWFPFGDGDSFIEFIHFILSLFVWDAAFTWCLINHCALLPELTTKANERGKLSTWASIAGLVGSLTIFPTYAIYDKTLSNFRVYCGIIGLLSLGIMIYACFQLDKEEGNIENRSESKEYSSVNMISFWRFFIELFSLNNFVVFISVNFLDIFTAALLDNFKVTYMTHMIETQLSKSATSFYFTICMLLPQIFGLLTSYSSIYYDTHSLITYIYSFRIFWCITSIILIQFTQKMSILYLLGMLVSLGSIGRLLEMSLANVVDEDAVVKNRNVSMSSSVYGINALCTKPAHSIAPMIGAFYLRSRGYGDLKEPSTELGYAIFYLFAIGSLITSTLQIFIWSGNTLKGKYLLDIKKQKEEQNRETQV